MAEDKIEEFFNELEIQNYYYSRRLGQPVFMIAETDLYDAIKKALEKIKH